MEYKLRFHVNNKAVELMVEPHLTLLEVLRDKLFLTGTKEGCSTGTAAPARFWWMESRSPPV